MEDKIVKRGRKPKAEVVSSPSPEVVEEKNIQPEPQVEPEPEVVTSQPEVAKEPTAYRILQDQSWSGRFGPFAVYAEQIITDPHFIATLKHSDCKMEPILE